VEQIGTARARWWLQGAGRSGRVERQEPAADHAAAVHIALRALVDATLPEPDAVGHRLVHGGPACLAPARLDDQLLSALDEAVPFAPLHLPDELACIRTVRALRPELPQVACFDTAFHRDLPERARRYALPRRLADAGVRRYGFHGLSYEYIVSHVGAAALGRAVLCHLGSGASVTAVRDGRSIDTSMGFTPTGGLVMSTRAGDLDPGVVVHLVRQGADARGLERLLNDEAGLFAIGGSGDMRTLLARRDGDAEAALAVEIFVYQLQKFIGAYAAALGGLDSLVFAGGIGERSAPIRHEVCRDLEPFGIRLAPARNEADTDIISAPESACVVRIVRTNEELMIARHTAAMLRRPQDPSSARKAGPLA